MARAAVEKTTSINLTVTFDYQAYPKQWILHSSDADEVFYGGAKGGAKALSLDTLIPTPTGWTTMGEIKVGDIVFGEHGQPVLVLAVSGIMHDRPCYKVKFDDGSEIVADEQHLWKTFTASDLVALHKRTDEYRENRRKLRPSRGTGKRPDLAIRNSLRTTPIKEDVQEGGIRTTKEISDTLTVRQDGLHNHAVLNATPIKLPDRNLLIDPYVLGAWLGDGTGSTGVITIAEDEMVETTRGTGYSCVRQAKSKYAYRIEGLTRLLRTAGVYKNKHIPIEYLRSSRDQRLALLQGIMDTDGHARKHGGVSFTNTNYELTKDVHELIVSLGWKAVIRIGDAKLNGVCISKKYDIVFTPDEYVFRMPRKIKAQRLAVNPITKRRFIVSCDLVDSVPVQCIKVSDGGMFLCGENMIPTHNSCGLTMDAVNYAITFPKSKVYLFRKTYDELEANLIDELFKRVPQKTKDNPNGLYVYDNQKHIARFVNGSRIIFRYIRNIKDAHSYNGREMDYCGVDEITQHEEEVIQILRSCVRSPLGYPARFRATGNPGNIGHNHVKKRYVVPTGYGKHTYVDKDSGNVIQFIPSKVQDNAAIMNNDPNYMRRLNNLPPSLRKAYRDGEWDIFEGQAFEEWNHSIHVCKAFTPPDHWRRWRSADNGYTDPFAFYWFAVSETGQVHIYREHTRDYGDPKIMYSEQAEKVVELSTYKRVNEDGQLYDYQEKHDFTIVGHDAFAVDPMTRTPKTPNGKSIVDYYNDGGLQGIVKCIPDRRMRKAAWHEYLHPYLDENLKDAENPDGVWRSKVVIHDCCKKLIETLPEQIMDPLDHEKVAETDYDHWYDGAGYGLVAFHIEKSKPPKKEDSKIEKHKKQMIKARQMKRIS